MSEWLFNPAVWLIAAAVIAAIEMLLAGFEFVGLSIGAALTGLLLFVAGGPIAASPYSEGVILVFLGCASLASWILIRRLVGRRRGQETIIRKDVNED
jgi:inner membrane protein